LIAIIIKSHEKKCGYIEKQNGSFYNSHSIKMFLFTNMASWLRG